MTMRQRLPRIRVDTLGITKTKYNRDKKKDSAMTMREKMARAMYDMMVLRTNSRGNVHLTAWEEQPKELHDDWLCASDAALDALMDENLLSRTILDAKVNFFTNDTDTSNAFKIALVIRAFKEGK